jgi:xylulose-5-phosphate/fructose-6-phosphate phosphoketolase
MSRYHLCREALRRLPQQDERTHQLAALCDRTLARHREYVLEHLEDMPEVGDWVWSD